MNDICNILTDKASYLIDERFYRPNKDPYYNLYLGYEEEILSLVIGTGGEYFLSLIDMRKKKVLLKNKKISSSKIMVNNRDVFFISGKSGKWALKKYSITKQNIQTLAKLKDIIDIEFSRSGLLFENSNGLWFLLYSSKNKEDIHFDFKLAGSCNGYPFVADGSAFGQSHFPDISRNRICFSGQGIRSLRCTNYVG